MVHFLHNYNVWSLSCTELQVAWVLVQGISLLFVFVDREGCLTVLVRLVSCFPFAGFSLSSLGVLVILLASLRCISFFNFIWNMSGLWDSWNSSRSSRHGALFYLIGTWGIPTEAGGQNFMAYGSRTGLFGVFRRFVISSSFPAQLYRC